MARGRARGIFGPPMLYRLVRPLLFLLDAETAHRLGFFALRAAMAWAPLRALVRRLWAPRDPALRTEALGLSFASPIGLAAGFDKDAEGYEALLALGFGAVEIGTVTAEAQPGNPRPRLFRLAADRGLLNRLGFNNGGAEAARARLGSRDRSRGVVGVNIGKTKHVAEADAIADYVRSAEQLAPLADYLVVNVSSPNTPGLRDLQATERLRPLLSAVQEAIARSCAGRTAPALLVKIAPDLADADVDAVADLALELGLAGIVATNTTIARPATLRTSGVAALGAGGISGAPVAARALEVLRRLRARTGDRLVLVSVGGIETAADAWERIRAGATLVQLYTGFVYGGPATPSRMARQLAALVRSAGVARVQDAVGSAPPGA